ncbi:MAG: NAD(+) synthase, partial [Planctomycetota bacterium]
MQPLQLGAASLNQTALDWAGNRRRIEAAIAAARDSGVSVLCLPELCISGYGCEDMFFAEGVRRASLASLVQIAPATRGMIVAVGLPAACGPELYNAAALLVDGGIVGLAAKQFLAGDGIHYEPRWFSPWPTGEVATVEIDGQEYPFGDLLFDCGGVRIGFEICRDAWVADRPGARLAERGADLLLNPSASHFAFDKQRVRERIVLEGSESFGVGYAYCNLLGNESGRAIYDGGVMVASGGRMLAAGKRFSFEDSQLTSAPIDVDALRRSRRPQAESPEGSIGGAVVASDFKWPSGLGKERRADGPAPTSRSLPQVEEFSRAVPLALFDYLRRSRSQGFVVSLSGGADSSAVAVMVHLMCRLSIGEIGSQAFAERLGNIRGMREAAESLGSGAPVEQAARALTGPLLACVYQATRNSSDTTRRSAETVADAIGAEFLEWSVDPMVDGYIKTVSQQIGRELTWESDDITLQNIQCRARGPGVWMIANLRGALLLATSNRSEAAVGYTTMDGDTCGGLSPLAGIDKDFLREWLRWMETEGPAGVGPIPALSAVNQQQPTAELRPPSAEQTDEGDLMPYDVLDAIERAAIRDKQLPVAAWRIVCEVFPDHSPQQLGNWVERFFQLWSRNQWKRERYAPSFHLDDENLDPKTWCRFPILSSG